MLNAPANGLSRRLSSLFLETTLPLAHLTPTGPAYGIGLDDNYLLLETVLTAYGGAYGAQRAP